MKGGDCMSKTKDFEHDVLAILNAEYYELTSRRDRSVRNAMPEEVFIYNAKIDEITLIISKINKLLNA